MEEDLLLNRHFLKILQLAPIAAIALLMFALAPFWERSSTQPGNEVQIVSAVKIIPSRQQSDPPDTLKSIEDLPSRERAELLFDPIIVQAAGRHEVDPALVRAVIMAESSYNPKAVSSRGAEGLMQLMPKTAEALGVEDTLDPEHNINGGVKYLKQLLKRFNNDVKLALAAYNAGTSNVLKYQDIPPFKATRYYVDKVFMYYRHYKGKLELEPGNA